MDTESMSYVDSGRMNINNSTWAAPAWPEGDEWVPPSATWAEGGGWAPPVTQPAWPEDDAARGQAAWPEDDAARVRARGAPHSRSRSRVRGRGRAGRSASPPAADSLAAWPALAGGRGGPRPPAAWPGAEGARRETPAGPAGPSPTPPRASSPVPRASSPVPQTPSAPRTPPPTPRRAGRVLTLTAPGPAPPPSRRRAAAAAAAPPPSPSPSPSPSPPPADAAARGAFRGAPGRAVGLSSRARGIFASLAHESPDFIREALAEIRGGNLVDIYQRNPCRWMHRGVGTARAHFVKLEEAKGASSIVVLVLFSKGDGAGRALIVSAFRRTHKGGRQYLVTPADLQALDDLSPARDRYGELADMCW